MSRTPEQRLLAAMSSLPGVSCVDDKPTGRGKLPNDHGVRWKLNGKLDRCACTVATGARPTLMHAIEGALAKLREALGADVVDQAVRDASAYSTEELAWLAEWCEEHPEPETITTQMADEALQQHRAAAAGQSTSNALLQQLQPRATAGREATAALQEAQLLRAQHSAAQRGVEKRCTIEGVMFDRGDYLVRIGRYFDRVATDPSGLTFEEWTPPDGSSSFVINATELRSVNFTMTPTAPPPPQQEVRRGGRRAAVVSTPPQPPPKEYRMDQIVDDDIRSKCW